MVTGRGEDSSRHDAVGSIAVGVVGIAAAVAGLGLVIVVTGLAGLALLYASAGAAAETFRCRCGRRRVQSPRDACSGRHS